jgi:hypothetical protein
MRRHALLRAVTRAAQLAAAVRNQPSPHAPRVTRRHNWYLITNYAAWHTHSSYHASCGCNTITPFPAPHHIVNAIHDRRLKCTLTRGFHRPRHSHPHERWAEGQRRRHRPSRANSKWERRAALTPDHVSTLVRSGVRVLEQPCEAITLPPFLHL